MPQFLRMSLIDGLTYNPSSNLGGPAAHYKFSKFKKSKLNHGLGVLNNSLISFRKHLISLKKFMKKGIMLLQCYLMRIYFK